MIWPLVSIPFWIIASALGFVGVAMVCTGLSGYVYRQGILKKELTQPQHEYFLIGLGYLACSGCVAYLAARLVS